jgi:hypothetical protein
VGNVDSWWDALVRDRAQAVLKLVLNAIADDYENVEIILKSINEEDQTAEPDLQPGKSGARVSRPEVIKALRVLTSEGYAQAFILDTREPYAQPVAFCKEAINQLWFYVTPKGIQAVKHLCAQIDGTD